MKTILTDTVHYYGVCGLENILFREYLSGRHQYVDYNDAKSETKSVSIGVFYFGAIALSNIYK